MVLLVRNRVKDVDRWKRVFDGEAAAGTAAGLTVLKVWRSVDAVDEVFFLLEVEDRERAEAFMASPESAAKSIFSTHFLRSYGIELQVNDRCRELVRCRESLLGLIRWHPCELLSPCGSALGGVDAFDASPHHTLPVRPAQTRRLTQL